MSTEGAVSDYASWHDLAARFRKVPEPDWEEQLCAHYMPPSKGVAGFPGYEGYWTIFGGASESERELFRSLAAIGAKALGHAGPDGWIVWLDSLRAESHDFRPFSITDHRPGKTIERQGGTIEHVCAASALYCELLDLAFRAQRMRKPLPSRTTKRKGRAAKAKACQRRKA